MSGAFRYLMLTRLKNQIRSLVKSPAKLIYAVIFIALLAMVLFAGSLEGAHQYRDGAELGAIVMAYYILMFTVSANSGFSTGASVFKMSDVNLLFTGPFHPQKVLFYGLFQQLGTSIIMGFFILYQYAWMHNTYGVTVPMLLLILVGYGLTVFTAQLAAMAIYALTASNEKRRRVTRIVFVAIPAAYALWLVYTALTAQGGILPALVGATETVAMRLYPVGGWIGGAVMGALNGAWGQMALGLGIWVAVVVAVVLLLRFYGPDYYEDVLQSTETSFAAQTAAKEGRVTEAAPKNIKTGKQGLGGGLGASAFYYKHKIENRRSKKFILSGMSLIFAVCVIVFSIFMRGSEAGFWGILVFSVYMQFFTVALGRLVKELTKPYIYLAPESSFRKLLWCIRESVGGFVVEAVLIFVPVGLILGLSPAEMLGCVLMRLGFDYLFLAGNIAAERLFGHVSVKMLIFLFYFLLLIILSVPGIVLAVILSGAGFLGGGVLCICIVMTVCNLLLALLVVFLCRNLLCHAELNG